MDKAAPGTTGILETFAGHIEILKGKASSLGRKINDLSEENRILKNKLDSLKETLAGKEQEIFTLRQQYEILQIARSMDSGEEGDGKTEELKKKINEYIKEIDQCLKLIGD